MAREDMNSLTLVVDPDPDMRQIRDAVFTRSAMPSEVVAAVERLLEET